MSERKPGWLGRMLGGGKHTGGVSPEGTDAHKVRLQSVADALTGNSTEELQGNDRTDRTAGHHRLGEGDDVSLDSWGSNELGRDELEDGEYMTGQEGTVPCDVVGRKRDSTKGKKGKKRWWG